MTEFSIFFPFKLTKTEVLICAYVDAASQGYSYKNVPQTYTVNLHKRVRAKAFAHKFTAFSLDFTTYCTVLFFLIFLTFPYLYSLFEFLHDTLVHMQPEVLNISISI